MGYSSSTAPINTTRQAEALRQAAIRKLRRFDIECKCKASLIVSCAVGTEPGCRERRHEGTCGCKPRWLPQCILPPSYKVGLRVGEVEEIGFRIRDKSTVSGSGASPTIAAYGCEVWRDGKPCKCPRMYMPRCLVTGCDQRRRGKHCECPRTTLETCKHVRRKITFFAEFFRDCRTPEEIAVQAEQMGVAWQREQRRLFPQLFHLVLCPFAYKDPPLADKGRPDVPAGPLAVSLMATRLGGGRHIWHPDDNRGVRSTRAQNKRIASNLLALARAMKGVSSNG